MLNQAIEKSTDSLWSAGGEWMYSMNVYHIIETVEFYGKNSPKDMEWGKRAGINWKEDSQQEIAKKKSMITKEQMKDYLDDIKLWFSGILAGSSGAVLFEKDDFSWFNSKLEKYIYSLRHSMHHIGELNKTLRDNDLERIEWQ